MNFKLVLSFVLTAFFVSTNLAQTDLQITKKITRTIPGMADLPLDKLPPERLKQLKEMNSSVATVYIKGASMRTDTTAKIPNKLGTGTETHTFSTVLQCDRQRFTTFDTKSKKYYQYALTGKSNSPGEKNTKTGGYITVSGTITDTGERAKIFGFEARRIKQSYVYTPGINACQKQKFQVETDGWYADIPEFSCPLKMALPENTGGSDCFDDLDYQIKGEPAGVPLKEVKKITYNGDTTTLDEEAIEVKRTTLLDSFFEPPAGYKAEKVISNSVNNTTAAAVNNPPRPAPATTVADSLPLPTAGIERAPVTEKKAGTVRIGIAKPKATTPETKNDPGAGAELADAVSRLLFDSLKNETVEAVVLETDAPESECKEKGCDYIFYADVTQKRGGKMFGKMLAMGALGAAGALIPGVGGIIASTAGSVIMGKAMGKAARAKDEFAFDYKVTPLAGGAILAQASTKAKAQKDGEDVLTPQIKQASTAVLGEIAKRK